MLTSTRNLPSSRIQRGDAKAALNAASQEIVAGGWQDIALALAQQISGDSAAADAALKTLVDKQANDAGYQIAQVYALRNDPDKVFEWLDRAWTNRDAGVGQLLYDPFIIRYQHDPRFAAFCRKVRLPVPGKDVAALAKAETNSWADHHLRAGVRPSSMSDHSFLTELKRRNVIRMAGLYLVGAWLLAAGGEHRAADVRCAEMVAAQHRHPARDWILSRRLYLQLGLRTDAARS